MPPAGRHSSFRRYDRAVKIAVVLTIAAAGIAGARVTRTIANTERPTDTLDRPYAPNPKLAPILALGYRELAADLTFVRMVGYFPSPESEPQATADLTEAMVELDPMFRRAYEFGAIAMTDARKSPDQALQLRAIALLERGARMFPTSYRFPMLAGQIYVGDLQTTDPKQRREWNEMGALLLESASRKPGAPADSAVQAAAIRSKLGQRQRAIDSLHELVLVTGDLRARQSILDKLAELEADNAGEIAAELLEQRKQFERRWKSSRAAMPATMYILIGPRIEPGFDLGALATGGQDVIGSEDFERLEPLTDP